MATTYDNASLVMIPSGVKEDKLYSIKPTDGSGDFTFSRGSDIQATRVNSSGLIEKAKENLLLYSQDFTNAVWTSFQSTTTTGQTDPNGGSTAVKIVSIAAVNSGMYQQNVSGLGSGALQTSSLWLKGESGGEIVEFGDATNRTQVTLTTDWVRYEGFANDDSTFFVIYNIGSVQTWYAAFAQVNHGLIAQDYVETTTTAVVEGLTADLPRLDYSGGASCPSLLLEPSRTNLITQSEYIDDAGWGKSVSGGTLNVTSNYGISPDGSKNATRIEASLTSGYADIVQVIGTSSGTAYTYSVYLKSLSGTPSLYFIYDGTANRLITLTTEWERYTFTIPSAPTLVYPRFLIEFGLTSSSIDILAYGAQLEAGSYPTSYIPTYGTAANRGVDNNYKDGLSVFGTNEGSFFVDAEGPNYNGIGANYLFDLSDNSSDLVNRFAVYAINQNTFNIFTNGGNSFTLDASIRKKILVIWNGTNTKVYANGAKVLDFTYANANPTSINLNSRFTGGEYGKSEFKQVLAFPTALTNAEAIALTTI